MFSILCTDYLILIHIKHFSCICDNFLRHTYINYTRNTCIARLHIFYHFGKNVIDFMNMFLRMDCFHSLSLFCFFFFYYVMYFWNMHTQDIHERHASHNYIYTYIYIYVYMRHIHRTRTQDMHTYIHT